MRKSWMFFLQTKCVLQGSCPQLLDAPLRTTQHPVDDERVGVGGHLRLKILVTNPTRVLARVSPTPKTRLRLEKQISTCCLTPGRLATASLVTSAIPTSASSS